MLKLHRVLLGLLASLALSQNAFALVVNDYVATSFTSVSSSVRVLSILDVGAAVEFDSANGESKDIADLCISFPQREDFSCSSDSIPSVIALEGQGTITVTTAKNIVFTPEDASFEGNIEMTLEVFINQLEAFDQGTLTLVISNASASITSKTFQNVTDSVDSICDGDNSDICTAWNTATDEEKVELISTLSPEEVVAEFTSTINMTRDQTGNLSSRLNALRGGAKGASIAGLNYIQDDQVLYGQWLHEMANQVGGNASADQNFSPFGFFINGSITSGDKDTTNNEQGYDLDGDSITIGVDYRFNDTLVAGVAYGISETEIEFSESNNEITNEIDNLLFYGTWYKDSFYIDAMLGYAKGDIETDRSIVIESIDVDEKVDGETESKQLFFSVTGNYDFYEGAWTYGPYAAFDYIDGDIDGYTEEGVTGFEVAFDDQDIKSQVLTFGGRAQYAWSQSWGIVIPYGRVEWKTELEDDRDAIIGRFVLDTSDDNEFAIEADDLDDGWFQVGVGVSATFQHGLSAYIDYETVVSYDDTEIDTFSFGGRWEAKF